MTTGCRKEITDMVQQSQPTATTPSYIRVTYLCGCSYEMPYMSARGRREWLSEAKHQDCGWPDCPNPGVPCQRCGDRTPGDRRRFCGVNARGFAIAVCAACLAAEQARS
jgi:hypothetical protein